MVDGNVAKERLLSAVSVFERYFDRQVPSLTTALASAVDGRGRPGSLSSSAPPGSCCAAASALRGAPTASAPRS